MLLTSSTQKGLAKRVTELGFAAYMTKPARPSALLDALAAAWSNREGRDEAVRITPSRVTAQASMNGGQGASMKFPGVRVLLVEDNTINQRVARLLLERIGARVDLAGNGEEAVQMTKQCPYDLVFMDCQMPVMDGYEATARIRQLDSAGRRVPIVAMTANAMQGDRDKCLAVGMDDYVTKPLRSERLEEAIAKWTHTARALPEDQMIDAELDANLRSMSEEAGDEFVADLVTVFLSETRKHVSGLACALQDKDVQKMNSILHSLKGSCGTLGAMRLAEAARKIEEDASAGPLGRGALDTLRREFARVEEGLSGYAKPRAQA